MSAELRGSAGADVYGTLDDLVALARELQSPTLVAPETLAEMTSVQFAGLNGVLPDVGRFDPNDWGLGVELRDAKAAALDRHAQLGADVRALRRQRDVPLDRSRGRPRARVPHRPRVRQLGARGVAEAVRRGAGGSVKVAVVGAGVMGLATARALAQRGHEVTVYEQFELKHKRGSSHGTSRIFRLSYDEEYWIRLAQRAYELWRELERESGRTLLELDGLVDVQRVPKRRVEALRGGRRSRRGAHAGRGARPLRLRVRRRGVARLHARRRHRARGRDDRRARRRRPRGRRRDPRAHARRVARRRPRRTRRRHGRRLGAEAPRPAAELDAKPTRETTVYFRGERDPVADRRARRPVLRADRAGRGGEGRLAQGRPADRSRRATTPSPTSGSSKRSAAGSRSRLPRVDPTPIRAETCIYTNVEDERFVCERRGRYVIGSACSGHGFKFAPAVGELAGEPRLAARAADPSSANSGRRNSSNVSLSQLATVAGVSARTFAVRGTSIASATSPK